MKNISIELPEDVALGVLVELEMSVRQAARDLESPHHTAVTRATYESLRADSMAARDAYRTAFRAALGYE